MRGKAGIPLLKQLKILDPSVKTEIQFDWLFLPKSTERTNQENKILSSLWDDCQVRADTKFKNKHCDFKDIYTDDNKIKGVSRRLEYDFYLPKYNLLIELDEQQHFTKERAITFQHYVNREFMYDIEEWNSRCLSLSKKDTDPLTRDWTRAFRDSIRDIRARAIGIPLIRLYISDVNQVTLNEDINCQNLKRLIEQKSSESYNINSV